MGFLYVLTNPSMPGLVKIGVTSKTPEQRASHLYSCGVPLPFDVAYRLPFANPYHLEIEVHKRLDAYRVNQSREFFKLSVEDAIDIISETACSIYSYENPAPYNYMDLHENLDFEVEVW